MISSFNLVFFKKSPLQVLIKHFSSPSHREDVPPPKSRVSTARSFTSVGSQRSSLGSMSPSNLHEYTKPQYDKIPNDEYERPPSHAPIPPPSRMAGPNLSRMGAIPVMVPAQNRDGSIV